MSRIRSKNTKPEIAVRSLLHYLGYRFRLHNRSLPGNPDIILSKYHTVIFVHGCFWHRHRGCRFAYTPKSRQEFWINKFAANVAHDNKIYDSLRESGWNILIIWECQTKDKVELSDHINSFFRNIKSK